MRWGKRSYKPDRISPGVTCASTLHPYQASRPGNRRPAISSSATEAGIDRTLASCYHVARLRRGPRYWKLNIVSVRQEAGAILRWKSGPGKP